MQDEALGKLTAASDSGATEGAADTGNKGDSGAEGDQSSTAGKKEVALGIGDKSFVDWAEENGYHHYMNYPQGADWRVPVNKDINNPDVPLHVALDQFAGGPDPNNMFLQAYLQGREEGAYATQEEMAMLEKAVTNDKRAWDSVSFYLNGEPVDVSELTTGFASGEWPFDTSGQLKPEYLAKP
ncbi:hypothetical protein ACWCQ1_46150 [Streptomyces sp. NPDC002144]